MNRSISLLFALMFSWVCLTSIGWAADLGQLRFKLTAEASERPHLSLTSGGRNDNHFGSSIDWADLKGLNPAQLRGAGGQPVAFALVREAGRVDCTGRTAPRAEASGSCTFVADSAFANLLKARGIGQPTERQAFALTMTGANRALIDAIAAARYPTPNIDDLAGLSALQVTPAYLQDLSRRGYRPNKISDLIAFKALGVTPAYIEELQRAGFGKLAADEIVQLKALDVSPAYLSSLRTVGYDRLSADEIVQLRALGVTADYIRGFQQAGHRMSVQQLVQCKAMGIRPEDLRLLDGRKHVSTTADDLIRLKVAGLLP